MRSIQENTTASELIAYQIEQYLSGRVHVPELSRYQAYRSGEGLRRGRSVYIPDAIWQQVEVKAQQGGFSVTNLVDALIKIYLGFLQEEDVPPQTAAVVDPVVPNTIAERYVRVGDKTFVLDENASSLDLKTGEFRPGRKPPVEKR